MSVKQLSKIQFGKETTRGTAVAADTILLGQTNAPTPDRKPTFPVEQFGVRAESVRAIAPQQYLVEHTLVNSHGYFQMLPVLFGCGLKGGVSPTEQNAGVGDYLWDFTPSLTGANAPDSLTVEVGDDTNVWEAEYCMFRRIKISGSVGQGADNSPVSVEADFFGRQWDKDASFTGGLSIPSAEPINAKLARIYVDTAWADVGTTEKADVLRTFDLEILTGIEPSFSGSANKYFSGYTESVIGAMGAFTFQRGAISQAIYDAYVAATFQVVRLEITGSQIGAGAYHSLKIDIGGYWETISPMGNEDRGLYTDPLGIKSVYDPTGAKSMQALVSTDVSAY